MICFDTNIVIYIARGVLSEAIIQNDSIAYASIVKIEALGYYNIRSSEEQRIRELLTLFTEVPLTVAIIEQAIRLRQQTNMKLGDAVMAATALEIGGELWTANVKDFKHLAGFRLVNPLENQTYLLE